MAISPTHLTAKSDSDGNTTIVTASISPGANRLILVSVAIYDDSGSTTVSSVVGNGITYTQVAVTAAIDDGAGPYTLYLYRGMAASPSAGAITATVSANALQLDIAVTEFDGVDTGGTNGSAAVVQSATNTVNGGTELIVTLAAFGDAGNGAFGCTISYNGRARTAGTGWTELSEVTQIQEQWRADNDTTCNWTWTTSDDAAGIAIEIKAAAAAGGYVRPKSLMTLGVGV